MNENKNLKLLSILGFVVFAGVSCWATEESLHLLLPSLPSIFCWAVTIGFFIVASFGTKLIVDSCNKDIYVENPGTKFVMGLLLVLVFWLVCSMPTNTHTFFFRNLIDGRVSTDISSTQGYLAQIRDNVVTDAKIQAKCAEVENLINTKLESLKGELENPVNQGNGPEVERILGETAQILGVAKIDKLSGRATTVQEQQRLYQAYRSIILSQLENKKMNIRKEMTPSNDNYKKVAKKKYDDLNLVNKYISDGTFVLTDAEDIAKICEKLNEGYSTIKTYQQYVEFKTDDEKALYTQPNPQTKIHRLLSVYDVWYDFVTGEEGGLSFVFWIIISILVDIAAFIFFDIAFKKR